MSRKQRLDPEIGFVKIPPYLDCRAPEHKSPPIFSANISRACFLSGVEYPHNKPWSPEEIKDLKKKLEVVK
jgi:hypothetical protein